MREQPPKTGTARRLWDLTEEEVEELFGDEEGGE